MSVWGGEEAWEGAEFWSWFLTMAVKRAHFHQAHIVESMILWTRLLISLCFQRKLPGKKKTAHPNQYCLLHPKDAKMHIHSSFVTWAELSRSVSVLFPFSSRSQLSTLTHVIKRSCYVSGIFLAAFRAVSAVSLLTLLALLAAYIVDCCAAGRKVCWFSDRFAGQTTDKVLCPSAWLSTIFS